MTILCDELGNYNTNNSQSSTPGWLELLQKLEEYSIYSYISANKQCGKAAIVTRLFQHVYSLCSC